MEQLYIVDNGEPKLSFPYDWKQTFSHAFSMARVMNEAQAVKSFISRPQEREMGLEILILLYNFTFATKDQLQKMLLVKGFQDEELRALDTLLESYLAARLMNKFTLSRHEMDMIPDDAYIIYCLDHAARHILSHFYRDDIAVTFKSTNAIRSSAIISKYIATNEFYLALIGAKTKTLNSFEPTVNFAVDNREIRMSATFRLIQGEMARDFVLDVVRRADLPVAWRKKVNEQIAPFLQKGHWRKYFRSEPVLILLVEDLELALEMADIFYMRTGSTNFRITTDEELLKGREQARFFKYEPSETEGQIGRMIPVSTTLFKHD